MPGTDLTELLQRDLDQTKSDLVETQARVERLTARVAALEAAQVLLVKNPNVQELVSVLGLDVRLSSTTFSSS